MGRPPRRDRPPGAPRTMARRPGAPAAYREEFSFVSPLVKYLLFFFNMLFWVISMVMVAVGVYARLMKHAALRESSKIFLPDIPIFEA